MINLILCGGSGTRLWPISRSLMPKQFARLFDGASLFQRTVKTNSRICSAQYIVSNAEQYFLAKVLALVLTRTILFLYLRRTM